MGKDENYGGFMKKICGKRIGRLQECHTVEELFHKILDFNYSRKTKIFSKDGYSPIVLCIKRAEKTEEGVITKGEEYMEIGDKEDK